MSIIMNFIFYQLFYYNIYILIEYYNKLLNKYNYNLRLLI